MLGGGERADRSAALSLRQRRVGGTANRRVQEQPQLPRRSSSTSASNSRDPSAGRSQLTAPAKGQLVLDNSTLADNEGAISHTGRDANRNDTP
jgi:hypothetical protein